MFGRKARQLASDLAAERNLMLIEIGEKDERIAALTAESKGYQAANRLNRQLRFEAQTEAKLMREKLAAAEGALQKIAAMVTPGSAPIGKRMAKVAADHLAGAAGVQAEAA